MHAPGFPALPKAAWAARIPRAAAVGLPTRHASPTRQPGRPDKGLHTYSRTQRIRPGFHTTREPIPRVSRSFNASAMRSAATEAGAAPTSEGDGTGNPKPGSGSPVLEQEGDMDSQVLTGGRSKLSAANSLRSRQARRRNASVLPPVHLPPTFLEQNLQLHHQTNQPNMPLPISYNAKKTSKPSAALPKRLSEADRRSREQYFQARIRVLTERLLPLHNKDAPAQAGDITSAVSQLQYVTRLQDILLEDMTQYVAALSNTSKPSEKPDSPPYWLWEDIGGVLQKSQPFVTKQELEDAIERQMLLAQHFDLTLIQTMSDFDPMTFEHLKRHLQVELDTKPPTNFDPKTSKRPISILLTSGYSGKAYSSAIVRNMAHMTPANLIELDAYDLSSIVGTYLGQDPAYSRGSLSMLGYRAAELNGRLPTPESSPGKGVRSSDDDDFMESQFITVRGPSAQSEELQKINNGDFDVFSKWDGLKIDKLLDQILRSPEPKTMGGAAQQKTIVHLHDYVELSMTLEGSFLISRLRALVDAAWHQGRHIVLLGTSSCANLSEEYQNMVREISAQDTVVTRHFHEMWRLDRWDVERADRFLENVTNIKRMIEAMDPTHGQSAFKAKEDILDFAFKLDSSEGISRFLEEILPAPEVYRVAQVYRSQLLRDTQKKSDAQHEISALVDSSSLLPDAPLAGRERVRRSNMDNDSVKNKEESSADQPELDPTGLRGLNEYEKRIAGGIISKDKLHVTFSDVHAPHDTISALKLLTSLTLQRPDAFSYGILKRDKINGCLLYGPPGTGKTMLAKAVAKDSGANMLELSGATINDKYVGESEKLIRAVFTLAKRLSPCVIFIDEADALLANRGMGLNRTVHRELINQFLRQWDGIVETNAFIMVATNRPFDLDDAVLRRLPRKLLMDLPTKSDREALLNLLLRDETLDSTVSLPDLAARTPFYSGSDLKNLCVAAAMSAVEEENKAMADYVSSGGKQEDWRYPDRRTLRGDHFEKGLKQIPASISEDMPSLKAIRKFDEEYGDGKKGRKKSKGMGFGMMVEEEKAVAEVKVRV
ncbi:hypothetical protein NLU13_6775 [Sarocladium strictum]|uniref:AAA+ ATPase domain-containing protein n=1 Tax=Sarocladium strictum TaxID=5046 RepID=A0AA39GE04_SARSR|nr:hypothetical protein NLU13_6775 [Sarocladium strictum]